LEQSWLDKLTVTYGQRVHSAANGYAYGLPIDSTYSSPGNSGLLAMNSGI